MQRTRALDTTANNNAGARRVVPLRVRVSAWARLHLFALAALFSVALIYVGALVSLPPQALTHHDEGAKYLQVRNLRLTPSGLDWSTNYPARPLDPQLEFVPFHPKQHYADGKGRIYLQWPIFLGLLTRIFWKVLNFPGLYVVPLLAGLGTMWVSYLLAVAVGLPRRVAWLAVPLVGLATPISIYSLLYFEHTVAALLVASSLLLMVRALRTPSPGWRTIAASSALLSLAVYFRSELYVLALVMGIGLLVLARRERSWRLPLVWGGAFALALVPLWAFYAINEGTPLPVHALWYFAGGEPSDGGVPRPGLPPLRYLASAGWGVVPTFLLGPGDAPLAPRFPVWVEVVGLAGTALCALAAIGRWVSGSRLWSLVVMLAGLFLVALATAATLLDPQPYYNLHGFLLASPFVALALWPVGGAGDKSGGFLQGVALAYVGLHALVISALSGLGPISLHEWGQRYLLPAYPLLIVLALLAVWRIAESEPRPGVRTVQRATMGLAVALVLVGVGFTARGYAVHAEERAQVMQWLALVETMPAREPLVTDVWWLPLNLAADFYARPIMLAEGDGRLTEWANRMRERGVTRFGFATNDQSGFEGDWTRQVPGLLADGPPLQAQGMWLQRYSLTP